MIKGTTVILITRHQTGADDYGRPVYEEKAEVVDDVLIGEPSTAEIRDVLELTGKQLAYTLAIPKNDTHAWAGGKVNFWGDTFDVIGKPTQGIDDNIPLRWNKKVKVVYRE